MILVCFTGDGRITHCVYVCYVGNVWCFLWCFAGNTLMFHVENIKVSCETLSISRGTGSTIKKFYLVAH